jgi:hypothetical protein
MFVERTLLGAVFDFDFLHLAQEDQDQPQKAADKSVRPT